MFKLPQHDTKALLAIHGWSGILLGLLLYVVICTGVAAVFAQEINDWSSPLAHPVAGFPPGLDGVVQKLAGEVGPEFLQDVAISESAGGRFNIRYHRNEQDPAGKPSERGVEFELDPQWQVLQRRAGWENEIEDRRRAGGIADFLINLHIRLHIPDPYGSFVTGILGLAMMIAAVTGFIVHRHLIADLFTLRLNRDALLRRRDLHVVAASWNLPFAFILAFTGSFFSLAASVGLPAIAMVEFGGNQEKLADTLYGTARVENGAPAPLASIERMIADARLRSGAEPDYVSIEHYGRADSSVTISTELPSNTLVYATYRYDGTNAELLRKQPPIGKTPSIGSSLVGLMYPLHFGNFAGAMSKAVWVTLGFAAAYVTLTGMLLWTRRRTEIPAWRRMARWVHYVGYGLPLALVCAPYAFFGFPRSQIPVGTLQGVAFVAVALLVAIATVSVENLDRLRRWLLRCSAVALLGLPIIRWGTGGMAWDVAWTAGLPAVPAVDVALIVIGCATFGVARSRQLQTIEPQPPHRCVTRGAQST